MKFLNDYKVNGIYTKEQLGVDALKFLEYSGRKALYSQGIMGQDIIVAVIDTGVASHPEFEDRLLLGYNAASKYSSSSPKDDNGHGTHCAGSIAGKTVGIAPKAKILPIKVLDATGDGEWSDIVKGINWARNWRGNNGEKVKIISMSLSSPERGLTATEKSTLETAINNCVADNILVVCSMGNTSLDEKRYPACFDSVVAVGAVDINKRKAEFSTEGNHVDVCQIGVDVISAYYEDGYIDMSGTSMSTPIVAGIAALLACAYKQKYGVDIPERKLYEALKMNTKDLGINGVDKQFGVGFATLQPLNMTIETELGSKTVKFNGEPIEVDVPTQIVNGRTLFEMRSFAEKTGAHISWEAENEYHKTRAKFSW